ncbi:MULTISPECIES: hypothetical protein [Streptomyces]|uniref:hypothetical protein n=1 Tax=Streptomyces TaxID=1883 RepID=UPI0013A5A39A|nr:hypothetical protein [Streptomyces sp. CS081A]
MSDFQDSNRQNESRAAEVARTAQDKAGDSASLVGGKAAEVGGTAKEEAGNVVGEAAAQAKDLAGELRTQLQGQAETQTQRLAENVRRLSQELRELGDNGKPDSTMADLARRAADGGHQVASHMEKRGPDGLVSDLQSFARRRPGVFLAGAALAGFVVARAGKSIGAASSGGTGGEPRSPEPRAGTYGTERPLAAPDPLPRTTPGTYEDPLDTYGQSQPPHVTPAPPNHPPAGGGQTYGGPSRPAGGI